MASMFFFAVDRFRFGGQPGLHLELADQGNCPKAFRPHRRGLVHGLSPNREHNSIRRLGKRQDHQVVAVGHVERCTRWVSVVNGREETYKISQFFFVSYFLLSYSVALVFFPAPLFPPSFPNQEFKS